MKKCEEAIKDFSEVLKLDPNAMDALCNRGSAQLQMGRIDLALADFDAGLKINRKILTSCTTAGLPFSQRETRPRPQRTSTRRLKPATLRPRTR